ncbi:MAG: hypothetical protein ACREFP_26580 [Acetobacteraceae bacterium]
MAAGGLTAPAFAGGSGGGQGLGTGLAGMLKGSEVSLQALAAARGQGGINLSEVTNTTNENVDASSSGTVNGGSVLGGMTGSASSGIVNSSGIISQFSNSGNNVLMSSSVAIFIDAH